MPERKKKKRKLVEVLRRSSRATKDKQKSAAMCVELILSPRFFMMCMAERCMAEREANGEASGSREIDSLSLGKEREGMCV